MRHILVLLVISGIMYLLKGMLPESLSNPYASATLSLGFLIIASYLIAKILLKAGLPKITGYIVAGILFGPSVLGFLTQEVLDDLKLVDDLALTVIAFAAGAELRMSILKERKKSIAFTLVAQILIVIVGVTASIWAISGHFSITAGKPMAHVLAIAAICGVVAVARSPASVIAIISETGARGAFTEMVLGVTVAADVLTLFLFATVLSLAEILMSGAGGFDFVFLAGIGVEVVASVAIGFLLSIGIAAYFKHVNAQQMIFVLGLAFLVTKFSSGLAWLLDDQFELHFHLEPMLICMTVGFFVQNRSAYGDRFLKTIERASLPIYATFFAISGATLALATLRETWHFALVLVVLRIVFLYVGSWVGGRLATDPRPFQKVSGLSFLAQAGVSLGLAKIVGERIHGVGPELCALIIAAIGLNQILGPITFKWALSYVGETKDKRTSSIAL